MENENKRDKWAEILKLQAEFLKRFHSHDLKNMSSAEKLRVWDEEVKILNSNEFGHHFASAHISGDE